MSMVIANNMQAVNTKRQFSISARGMSGAMEKLSSGYKINSGKDDPSGIVISEQLRSQINGLKRAQQNTEEAINVMGIAEGALNEMNAILKKMKALAIHSNNTGVTSPDQVAADQAEMDSAIQTLDRIAQTTKFSDQNLLNGSKDITFDQNTLIKGTQQNTLLNARESSFSQIFKRDGYAVSINFTGTTNADNATGMGDVDFSQQATRAYLEVDTAAGTQPQPNIDENGNFTKEQSFTLTGNRGSRSFTLKKGTSVTEMVSKIKGATDSTGVDAALIFNSAQRIDKTAEGKIPVLTDDDYGITWTGDRAIDLTGLKTTAGDQISLSVTADKDIGKALSDAMAAANSTPPITSLGFKVNMVAGGADTYSLTAVDNNGGEYTIATGWDGTTAGLSGSIAVTATTGDAGVATALADLTFSVSGNIDIDASEMVNTYSFSKGMANLPTITIDNLYGEAVSGATNGSVTVDFDASTFDLATVYDAIEDDALRDRFRAAAETVDGLTFGVKVSGTQGNMTFTLSVSDATGVLYNEDISGSKMGIIDGKATNFPIADSVGFKGAVVTAKDIDTASLGYQASNPFTGTAATGAASNSIGRVVIKAAAGGTEPANTSAITATGGAGFSASQTIDNLKYDSTSEIAFTFSTMDGTLFGITDANSSKNDFTFTVTLNAGSSLDAPSYTVTATNDDRVYLLNGNWNGAATDNIIDANSVTYLSGGAGELPGLVSALKDASLVADNAVSVVDSFSAAADWTSGTGTATIPVVVAEGLYTDGIAEAGKVTVDFGSADWGKILAAVDADKRQDFVNKLNSGDIAVIIDTFTGADQANFAYNITLVDKSDATTKYVTLAGGKTGIVAGVGDTTGTGALAEVAVTFSDDKTKYNVGYDASKQVGSAATAGKTGTSPALTVALTGARNEVTDDFRMTPAIPSASGQTGGVSFDKDASAARNLGTVAVFNNTIDKNGSGTVIQGVNAVELKVEGRVDDNGDPVLDPVTGTQIMDSVAADSIQFGKNTDGQGRIYVKFLDDDSFELYKDSSLSEASKVATGISGEEIKEYNNSGLTGITLELQGTGLASKSGVYMSFAGIEGHSTNTGASTMDGVRYNGSVVNKTPYPTRNEVADPNDPDSTDKGPWTGTALFDSEKTYITGVELGKNTSDEGTIYLKNEYIVDKDTGAATLQVSAYKHRDMRDSDLVAQSAVYEVRNAAGEEAQSLTVVLNEIRNKDDTAGTGLGMVLSVDGDAFAGQNKSATMTGDLTFTNLGARVFASDYGSKGFVKLTQDKGAIFHEYSTAGNNNSKRLIDAGSDGVILEVKGQDATLAVGGSEVKTDGLTLKMATEDIQASLVFNQGKVGSTTIAQVGYGDGSIFTKIGALNLGATEDAAEGSTYEHMSGYLCNAGHVTNEKLDSFDNGMQLQLGEGSGDQNRTIVAIKSMTSENLGRITKGGNWETGSAVYTERVFTMKDVMGGGLASLSSRPTLAMEIIEKAITDVSEVRAQIGAVQSNLLQTNSNNLAVSIENIQKTESGIRDADMADEM
ncbi:MAG: hypothetical protein LUC93_03360, partial [Planctomycetaceae bacterium]|nr:hypothetical protein [Planctomycetaceae bacterium]